MTAQKIQVALPAGACPLRLNQQRQNLEVQFRLHQNKQLLLNSQHLNFGATVSLKTGIDCPTC